MSFMYYDATILPRMELNNAMSLHKKFKDYWGTKTVNNKTVYDITPNRLFYINGSFVQDKPTKRFVKSLGIEWDTFIKQDVDSEITSMYFKLKPGFKYSGEVAYGSNIEQTLGERPPTLDEITHRFNSEFTIGSTINVTITYGGRLMRYIDEHSLEWSITDNGIVAEPLNTTEIRQVLDSNPWYYYANSRHINYTSNSVPFTLYDGSGNNVIISGTKATYTPPETPVCDTSTSLNSLGVMSLLDTKGSVFERILDSDGNPVVINEKISTVSTDVGEVVQYEYTYQYKYKGMSSTNQLPVDIVNWYQYYKDPDYPITSIIDTKIKHELISFMVDDNLVNSGDSNSFYTFDGRSTYPIQNTVDKMKKREFTRFLGDSIDIGYSVKKASFFEKTFALLIIVIAIVVTVLVTRGADGGALIAAAAGASAGALTLTIGNFILSSFGGLSAQGLVKTVGKFAAVAGAVGTILGIYAAINNMLQRALATEITKQAVKDGTMNMTETMIKSEIAKMSITEVALSTVKGALTNITSAISTGFTNITNISVSQVANYAVDGLKIVLKGFEFYSDKQNQELQAERNALQAEEDKYNEEMLNKPYVQEPGIFMVTHEKLSTPDMLQDLAIEIDSRIGKDKNFHSWLTNVNS